MVNVGKYTIHVCYGYCSFKKVYTETGSLAGRFKIWGEATKKNVTTIGCKGRYIYLHERLQFMGNVGKNYQSHGSYGT